jgi:hypothetical protein
MWDLAKATTQLPAKPSLQINLGHGNRIRLKHPIAASRSAQQV